MDCCITIDYEIASKVLPEKVVKMMKHFNVQLLDLDTWMESKKYEPSIGSLFAFGQGGSYDFRDETFGIVYIHNGTISSCERCSGMNAHSRKYYEAFKEARRQQNVQASKQVAE